MASRTQTPRTRDLLVSLPTRRHPAAVELGRRVGLALMLLVLAAIVVLCEPDGYSDNVNQDGISFIDALYYATVTVTTTGYGDITPVSPMARLLNIVLITPLRIAFLVLLVGTTLEVLANEGVRAIKDSRWRKRMRDHSIIVGYGTKGRAAMRTLRHSGRPVDRILILDARPEAIARANEDGCVGLVGDVTKLHTLRRAEVGAAKEMILTLDQDDTAILTTLASRQLNPDLHIVAAVREETKIPMFEQSGANEIVASSDVVGRLMGLSSVSPMLGNVLEDLLSSGEGLEVNRRPVAPEEVGRCVTDDRLEKFIGIERDGRLVRWYEPGADVLRADDVVLVMRAHEEAVDDVAPLDTEGTHG